MDKKIKIAVSSFEKDPSTVKFKFFINGEKRTGFALLFEGGYYVYKNQCQHLPVELDWEDNDFFDETNKFIVCATHGALYEPQSGHCIAGPCNGENLISMAFEVTKDNIVITV